MATIRPARDNRLLDAIDALPAEPFSGRVWRVVRDGRDPLQCSAVGGRWDDRSFYVLYTAMTAEGAVAEMYFHLSRGQPVMPSQVGYRLFELSISLIGCIRFAGVADLAALGLKSTMFGQLSYAERQLEYPRTQEIAEAAYFLGRDGLIVPSARSASMNVIVHCDRTDPDALEIIKDHGVVNWDDWRAKPGAARDAFPAPSGLPGVDVVLRGWKPGLNKVKLTKMLRAGGIGLGEASKLTGQVLDGVPVRVHLGQFQTLGQASVALTEIGIAEVRA